MNTINSYSKYLQIDKIITAQQELSNLNGDPCHDEMLFIITHQAYELWFKQILHELKSINTIMTADFIPDRNIPIITSRCRRVIKIFKLINQQVDILETMTPMDFLDFRKYLGDASGFQSVQFRELEVLLGREFTPNKSVFKYLSTEDTKRFFTFAGNKSLKHNINKWLENMPFLEYKDFNFWQEYKEVTNNIIQKEILNIENNTILNDDEKVIQQLKLTTTKDAFAKLLDYKSTDKQWSNNTSSISKRAMLSALFISLYRNEPILYMPYVLLSSLMDIDAQLAIWRKRHVMMVQRMIGNKTGTGGSSGQVYLESTIEKNRYFADLYHLANFMIPYSELPKLPVTLQKSLDYSFS